MQSSYPPLHTFSREIKSFKENGQGRNYSTADRVLALYSADQGSIPDTPYSPSNPLEVIPEGRTRGEPRAPPGVPQIKKLKINGRK